LLKIIGILIASLISYLALTAIFTTPVFFNNHIKNYYLFSGMMLAFLLSILIIFKSYRGLALRKKHAIFIAVFIGIVFSTYLDSFLNTSILMILTNSIIAVLLGILLANTDSKHKREDLLIFLWCYVPIKFITIIALLKGTMVVKMNSPFISFFIMGIVVVVLRKTFYSLFK
jgi:hypothetical protein